MDRGSFAEQADVWVSSRRVIIEFSGNQAKSIEAFTVLVRLYETFLVFS